ncbi:MAG: GNAT family N-acetyltransferase [bacterium]
MQIYEHLRDDYRISTDKLLLNLDTVAAFLARAYWAQGRTRKIIQRSFQNSICFGLYTGTTQVGFARVISDCATFAYLCDVFVDESHRGKGLGKWLVSVVMSHPDLQGLRRWSLATRDAHELYRPLGWTEIRHPETWMEILSPPAPEPR